MSKVNVILARTNDEVTGGFDKEVMSMAADPRWAVPSIQTVNHHNYEVRGKDEEGDVITYSLSDSAVDQ